MSDKGEEELTEETETSGVDYIQDITRFNNAMRAIFRGEQTREQELVYIASAQAGDIGARDCLVAANSQVIVIVVWKTINKGVFFYSLALEPWDLLQEGIFGFYDAIKKFEDRGTRLATYAIYRVKDSVLSAVRNSTLIPSGSRVMARKARILQKRKNAVKSKLGREPRQSELLAGLSSGEQRILADAEVSVSRVDLADAGDIPDDRYYGIETVSNRSNVERLHQLLVNPGILKENERRVLEMRYLSNEEKVIDYDEIGARMGISSSRACQLNGAAITKLHRYF